MNLGLFFSMKNPLFRLESYFSVKETLPRGPAIIQLGEVGGVCGDGNILGFGIPKCIPCGSFMFPPSANGYLLCSQCVPQVLNSKSDKKCAHGPL